MAAGHIVNGQCVDVAASADLYFSSKPGSVVSGLTTYEMIYTKPSTVWNIKSVTYSSSGVATNRFEVPAVVPTFPTCDTADTFIDGVTIGWGIAAAMVAAWLALQLRRAL